MEKSNESKLTKLSTEDSIIIGGGGFSTGMGSLFRSSVSLGFAGAHAAYDFASGFIDRFTANTK